MKTPRLLLAVSLVSLVTLSAMGCKTAPPSEDMKNEVKVQPMPAPTPTVVVNPVGVVPIRDTSVKPIVNPVGGREPSVKPINPNAPPERKGIADDGIRPIPK